MKLLVTALAVLCLAIVPALADVNNGNINGTTDAWTFNFGYVVSDTFVPGATTNIIGFQIGLWEFPGDTVTSLDWSISSAEFGGTVYGSGTASGGSVTDTFISSNQFGYNIDKVSVTGLSVPVTGGVTYWLNLANASVASGDPVYWDENSGPASASESALGTIPSEAFTINGSGSGGDMPEPSSILLFGSGVLGLAGVLRRKINL